MKRSCARLRSTISAVLDGEATPAEEEEVNAHLATCADCDRWVQEARSVTRRVAMSALPETPDVSAAVVQAASRHRRPLLPAGALARTSLVSVGLTQILLAGFAFTGDRTHVAREMVAVDIALGLAALAVAARPARADGMLPLLLGLTGLLLASSVLDLADGWTKAASELPHLLVLGELVLVWRIKRIHAHGSGSPTGPPGRQQQTHLRAA